MLSCGGTWAGFYRSWALLLSLVLPAGSPLPNCTSPNQHQASSRPHCRRDWHSPLLGKTLTCPDGSVGRWLQNSLTRFWVSCLSMKQTSEKGWELWKRKTGRKCLGRLSPAQSPDRVVGEDGVLGARPWKTHLRHSTRKRGRCEVLLAARSSGGRGDPFRICERAFTAMGAAGTSIGRNKEERPLRLADCGTHVFAMEIYLMVS